MNFSTKAAIAENKNFKFEYDSVEEYTCMLSNILPRDFFLICLFHMIKEKSNDYDITKKNMSKLYIEDLGVFRCNLSQDFAYFTRYHMNRKDEKNE